MSCCCLYPRKGKVPVPIHCENNGRDVEFIGLDAFLPRVTLVAQGVPDDVAIEYIRQSAMRLAKDSRLLKRTAYADVQAGVADYYIANGEQEQINLLYDIQLGKPHSWCGGVNLSDTGCFVALQTCRNPFFTFEPPDKVILARTPKHDGEKQLRFDYYAVPTQNCCKVDKLLYDRYHDTVVNGALADLLLMRKYEFADPQLALAYDRRFQQGIAQAKVDVSRQFMTGTQLLQTEMMI